MIFTLINPNTRQVLDQAPTLPQALQLLRDFEDEGTPCEIKEEPEESLGSLEEEEALDGDLVSFLLSTIAGVY